MKQEIIRGRTYARMVKVSPSWARSCRRRGDDDAKRISIYSTPRRYSPLVQVSASKSAPLCAARST